MEYRQEFNWSHVNLFVAVANTGSLSAAARETGVSQPTIGRAMAALEEELGVTLLTRHTKGFSLTEQGRALLAHAQDMVNAAAQLSLAAAGRADELAGTVRITASRIVATYVLPSILAQMKRQEPRIQVELVATDVVENLLYRDADIAIRMVRPTQSDLIAKQVGEMPMGVYASHSYLAERPAPVSADDLALHSVIGYDKSTLILDSARELGLDASRDFFQFRCDDQIAYWQMVLAGLGIGFTARPVAQGDDRVIRILHDLEIPSLPLWLTAHSALKSNRRIRFVYDFLGEALQSRFQRASLEEKH